MFKKPAYKFFYLLIFAISTFFIVNNVAARDIFHMIKGMSYKQKVYYADEPLTKLAEEIRSKKPGISDRKIAEHFKRTLRRITPEFAKKEFGITWKEVDMPKKLIGDLIKNKYSFLDDTYFSSTMDFYPTVAICKLAKVGYGLFLIDGVRPMQIISTYTGDYKAGNSQNDYSADFTISNGHTDATNTGNTGRFANGFIKLEEFSTFSNEVSADLRDLYKKHKNKGLITESNASFTELYGTEGLAFLISNKEIKPFQQAIAFYGDNYWGGWYNRHKNSSEQPCLFKENGDVICALEDNNDLKIDVDFGEDLL